MQILKTVGYVLERKPNKRFDEIIIIFSKDLGKVEILGRSLRKPNSKLSSTLSLFNKVEVILTKKVERFILKTAFLLEEINFRNFTHGLSFFYLKELVEKILPLDVPEENAYRLFESTIQKLDQEKNNKNIPNILHQFNKNFLTNSGLVPSSLFDKNYDKIIRKTVPKKALIFYKLILDLSR